MHHFEMQAHPLCSIWDVVLGGLCPETCVQLLALPGIRFLYQRI